MGGCKRIFDFISAHLLRRAAEINRTTFLVTAPILYQARKRLVTCLRCARYDRERERERKKERGREREKDGSDVTLVVLKLAMSLHVTLPKICTLVPPVPNGAEFTLSVAKNSHFL